MFYLLYSLHHPLPELLGLLAEQLGLAPNEFALDLDEFLGFFDTQVQRISRPFEQDAVAL